MNKEGSRVICNPVPTSFQAHRVTYDSRPSLFTSFMHPYIPLRKALVHLYSCICMYHTHSDAVCFWAVILLYTLYLDDIMTVVTMYIYVIWMYVCIGCSMMTLNFTLCTCINTQLGNRVCLLHCKQITCLQ